MRRAGPTRTELRRDPIDELELLRVHDEDLRERREPRTPATHAAAKAAEVRTHRYTTEPSLDKPRKHAPRKMVATAWM